MFSKISTGYYLLKKYWRRFLFFFDKSLEFTADYLFMNLKPYVLVPLAAIKKNLYFLSYLSTALYILFSFSLVDAFFILKFNASYSDYLQFSDVLYLAFTLIGIAYSILIFFLFFFIMFLFSSAKLMMQYSREVNTSALRSMYSALFIINIVLIFYLPFDVLHRVWLNSVSKSANDVHQVVIQSGNDRVRYDCANLLVNSIDSLTFSLCNESTILQINKRYVVAIKRIDPLVKLVESELRED